MGVGGMASELEINKFITIFRVWYQATFPSGDFGARPPESEGAYLHPLARKGGD